MGIPYWSYEQPQEEKETNMATPYPYPPNEANNRATVWDRYNDQSNANAPKPDVATARQVGGAHYKQLDPEPIVAMKAWLSPEEYRGYLRGNIIKYQARAQSGKEPINTALEKAAHYQQFLTEHIEEERKKQTIKTNNAINSQVQTPRVDPYAG